MKTTLELSEQIGGNAPAQPVFIRLPKYRRGVESRCPWTGLTRGYMARLAIEKKIRSVELRERGVLRGIRLINLESLLEFLKKQESGPEAATAKTP